MQMDVLIFTPFFFFRRTIIIRGCVFLTKWQPVLGRQPSVWFEWGSCFADSGSHLAIK